MKITYLIVLFLSCLLCSCGGTDYTYVDTNEQKIGSGLFSGEDGVFTVMKKEPAAVEKSKKSTKKADQ